MIPDSHFPLPQSPFFFFSKSWFCPVPSPCFSLLKVPFSSFSQCPVSSSPSSSLLFRPLPSSPIHVSILSVLFLPLQVLSPPPPQSQKQRNDTKPSRRSWLWLVPKWNMILSLLVRPQTAVARLEHLVTVVPVSKLLPGLAANVMIHSNVKQAVIARPTADE